MNTDYLTFGIKEEKFMAEARRLLAEGKTKKVFAGNSPQTCIFEMKDDVTMHDDPAQTIVIPGKGAWSNTTTCCMFEVLDNAGVPVAFLQKLSDVGLEALLCNMISLEMVARRVARGSYCQRRPGTENTVFEKPVIEFYLKTSKGALRRLDNTYLSLPMPMVKKKSGEGPLDDPLIINPYATDMWELRHPHLAEDDPQSLLQDILIKPGSVLGMYDAQRLEKLTEYIFLVLEKAWQKVGCALHDIKFEFGFRMDGTLCLADVVDADSWRMLDPKREEMSKQVARDGGEHPEIIAKYRQAAEMAEKVRDIALQA